MLSRFLVIPFYVLMASAALAQTEAEKCTSVAPLMRALADESQALLTKARDVLPNDIKQADRSAETQAAAKAQAGALLAGAPGEAFGEFAASTVRVLDPLTDFAERTAAAAALLESCATN